MGRSNRNNQTSKVTEPAPKASTTKTSAPSETSGITLPSNLPKALRYLDDTQLKTLLRDVTAEIKRREPAAPAKPPHSVSSAKPVPGKTPKVSRGQAPPEGDTVPLGKANLIRASFKAGVKPAAIARTFGISQALVNQVLGAAKKPRR